MTEKLKADLTEALRSGDALKVEVLRGLQAAIHNREIELRAKGRELTGDEVTAVIQREAKKRKEAAEIYTNASRAELAEKESKELGIIKSYLPAELRREEIEEIVKRAAAAGEGDFGRTMGMVMKEVGGRAESSLVKEIVEKELAGKNG